MPFKRTLIPVLIATSLLLVSHVFGQNFILPDGEYMDTTSHYNTTCKDYNVYYYQVGGKYPKSSSTILKDVQQFLKINNEIYPDVNGYITFRFTIDCEGKLMQKIQVLQTNEKYISCHFNKNLVNELFAFLKTLNKWNIAKTKDGETFLYKAFITFKIQDGKVINIIP